MGEYVGKVIGIIVGVLLGIAYLTVAERKYLSGIQRRRGPNVVGYYGLLQAIGDGLKLLVKETTKPTSANSLLYMLAPLITFTLSLIGWAVIPLGEGIVYSDINIGIMYILGVSALGIYGIIIAGWSSNSKYAMLGAIRSTAQMISYEVSIGFTIITVILCVGTMNMTEIVLNQESIWNCIPLLPITLIMMISILAETNRHPFDLPEAEAELVSGYNVEYSAGGFVLFFLGEYGNILLMSSLMVILLFGGWLLPGINREYITERFFIQHLFIALEPLIMSLKIFFIVCIFIWARGALPRYRYDQLMEMGWKKILPLTLGCLILSSSILQCF